MTKAVLRNFTKFTGKQAEACNFIKKEALAQVFSCEFYQNSKTPFLKEHLRTTASVNQCEILIQCHGFVFISAVV